MVVKKKAKVVVKKPLTPRQKLEPTVKKAVDIIHKKFGVQNKQAIALFSGRTVVVPKQTRYSAGARLDIKELTKITTKRIRERRRPFSGIIMYIPSTDIEDISVNPEWMCPMTENTFQKYRKNNPKFHCIMANKNKRFRIYTRKYRDGEDEYNGW